MNISAVDKSTNKKQEITIQSSGGLTDAEVDSMVKDAETYKENDEKKKAAVSAKNEAETLTYSVEKQLDDFKDKISDADKADLKDKLEKVRLVMTSEDGDEIRSRHKQLQEASWKISQQVYSQQSSSDQQQQESSGGSAGGEEKKAN
eukprot:GHVS01021611.1.p1 GENE.GHVS01021611.1~~GHVS01021611.1.p1  ORF type:complete len:147 (+),score=40.75 GHVS01021611.1:91-531(+)